MAKCEVEHDWRKCWRDTCQQLGGCAEKLKSAPFERQVDTVLKVEHEADIRSKVNPLYRDQRGTESHERAMLLGEIDRLRAEVAELRQDSERLDWVERALFECKWLGGLDSPSHWFIRGDYRHTTQVMRGETIRVAIDAALAKDSSHE